ncbi:hypothetical protein PHLCEN_2v5873 [Hermanssonia centrifuga]|uniref:Uncharacterized protein n=1 Tax=Hermanssonia centrifuga TaxID=98765 RepID=A0A2R6P170_9APHY|nr:hypothetical protein PHLCEN_2v5873 [Hermanssonia centrifuga]
MSTASLQFVAPVNSSAGSKKLPFSRRLLAGSMGRALNVAKVTSLLNEGAAALVRIRDSAESLLDRWRARPGDEGKPGD